MKIEWIEKYLTEAEQLIFSNQVEQGMAILQDLLFEEPGYGELHNYLGWAYLYYCADTKKAELHFQMAMHFDVDYHAPYLHMASLCMRTQRYAEVLVYAEKGLTKNGANVVALYEMIGLVYELKGEFGRAIKAYKAAATRAMATHEMNPLTDGIKRCWRKRVTFLFAF